MRNLQVHIIVALFIIGSMSSTFAQTFSDEGQLNLAFELTWSGSKWVSTIQQDGKPVREGWQGYEIQKSDSIAPRLISKQSGIHHEIDWSVVRGVRISVGIEKGREHPVIPVKLSNFKGLDGCPVTCLNWLVIDYSQYGGRFHADLENCIWLEKTREEKTLRTFHLTGNHVPEFEMSALFGQPLLTLKISKTVGEELTKFPTLAQIEMPGLRNAFAHHAYSLPNLRVIRDVEGAYFNRFHYEHAERFFWIRTTKALHRPVYSNSALSREVYSSPLNVLTENVKYYLPDKWVKKGEVYVTENELPARTHDKGKGDTLLHGFVKRGKLKGVWTFRVEEQYDFNDFESFHLDLKAKPIELPENGDWLLKYVGGDTAIAGTFLKNKKVGDWEFFNEAGALVCTRSYENDTLKRTVVNFHMHGTPLESRAYYLSENTSIQSFQSGNKVQFIFIDLLTGEPDPIVITENSISILDANRSYQVYYRNHPDFETIFREQVIDKVFPEYIGQEFPFEY